MRAPVVLTREGQAAVVDAVLLVDVVVFEVVRPAVMGVTDAARKATPLRPLLFQGMASSSTTETGVITGISRTAPATVTVITSPPLSSRAISWIVHSSCPVVRSVLIRPVVMSTFGSKVRDTMNPEAALLVSMYRRIAYSLLIIFPWHAPCVRNQADPLRRGRVTTCRDVSGRP